MHKHIIFQSRNVKNETSLSASVVADSALVYHARDLKFNLSRKIFTLVSPLRKGNLPRISLRIALKL